MDLSRVRQGELIAGIAGIALFLVMIIFDWFSVDLGEANDLIAVDTGRNAFQAFGVIDIVLLIAVIVAVGLAVLTAAAQSPNLPVAAGALTAALGGLATILVVIRIISPPDMGTGDLADVGREIGVWLGLIASGAIAYGGWLSMREEGSTFSGEADRLRSKAGGSGESEGGPPPPPPPAAGGPPSAGPSGGQPGGQ